MILMMVLVCALSPASAAQQETGKPPIDRDEVRRRLKDPTQVFPVFQELIAAGEYGIARDMLSRETAKILPQEAFTLAFTTFEVPRRMIASLEQHAVDVANLRVRLCSKEFGVSREFRIVKFMTIYALDFTSDDIEFLKGRPMAWYRLQVKRADGWHYAYPPDWTYAPLARTCVCGK
jgi:hypothetical protein